jgi:hypothetical protein
LGGLLSMLSRDRRRNSLASSQAVASLSTTTEPTIQTTASLADQQTVTSHADVSSEISIDPDYTDFASGMVNTTRGEVRTGPRSRAASSSDELSSLLGAYLAAASLSGDDDSNSNLQLLSRLLRDRGAGGEGGNGGGIDIHIHAVVTTPGMVAPNAGGVPGGGGTTIGGGATAGLGGATGLGALLAGLGGGATTTTTAPTGTPATTLADDLNFLQNTRRPSVLRLRTPAALQQQDDDLGIFSELYSENPEPDESRRAIAPITPTALSTLSPARATVTPTSPSRSSRRSSRDTTPSSNNNSSNTPQRRTGFLGRFLRRNQSSD